MAPRAWVLALAAMLGGAASAAELPLQGAYGNAAGCALATQAPVVPQGNGIAFAAGFVIYKRERCRITDLSAAPNDSWKVGIACASGHDGDVPATLIVAPEPSKTSVKVTLVEGDGPAGQFRACPAR